MIRARLGVGLIFGLAVAGALTTGACTVTSSAVPSSDGGTAEAAPADSTAPHAGSLGFVPSNVDLGAIDLSKLGDFIVDGDCTIDTDTSLASCGEGAGDVLGFAIETQSDGSKVAVYAAKSVSIPAGKSLTVHGSLPLVMIALATITIDGALKANAVFDTAVGGGAKFPGTTLSKGAGSGGGGTATLTAAGGGGSYCGTGGAGGAESGPSSNGGPTYGTPDITPLVGGSSGGGAGGGGAGGGAIQLVAGTSITIGSSGSIHVGAGGGAFGGVSGQEANGGGSGGSILLESLAVNVAGTLAANGGGGGAGTSSDVGAAPPLEPGGANATPDATPAAGGKAGIGPSSGGTGSGGAAVDGTAGAFTANNSAGGGGGGAGRIRINTSSSEAALTGTISPAISTACVTRGKVHGLAR